MSPSLLIGAPSAAAGAAAGVSLERLPELGRLPPLDAAGAFRDLPGLVLLESARPGRRSRWSYLAADPSATLEEPSTGKDPFAGARALLARVGGESSAEPEAPPFTGGLAGYLSYDLGRTLESVPSLATEDQPLPWLRLGLHDWVLAWDRQRSVCWLAVRMVDGDRARQARRRSDVLDRLSHLLGGAAGRPDPVESDPLPVAFRSNLGRDAFCRLVAAVRDHIGSGELYQANIARRLEAAFSGDPWPVHRRLRTGDPVGFGGYLELGPDGRGRPRALLSASPEPFLHLDRDGTVSSDPIKGTRPRGRTRAEDRALAAELLASKKDRAENTMIVDVLRNDLGRVCEPGTVRVPRLRRLERTGAVQHLVSTVSGRLSPGRDAFDVLAASFPGGSVTDAPKIRAMQLIEELEPVRRGPYTGSALWIDASGTMGSSILIRTLVADGRRLTLHVGGGITWRSDPLAEWEETRAKARGPLGALGAVELEP